jgi:glycosyltransferase involved in cell wall biosynthesis
MNKLALAMIVKGTDEEAKLLDRCLGNISPYVDGIFITSTYADRPNAEIDAICAKYGAVVSYFRWENDFAKARNYNFAQVPKDFEYIMWCDADDVWRGLEGLREMMDEHKKVDAFGFWYLYEFDEHKQPVVAHKKTQIVRNDGCVEWAGALHEDFKDNRSVAVMFVEGIERMHFTTETRVQLAKKRNIEVSKKDYEANSDDPRTAWNYANSLMGDGKLKEARKLFESFMETSGSEEETYLARLRIADIWHLLGDKKKAVENYQLGIGMRPDYSDGYLQIGYVLMSYHEWKKAEYYLLNGLVKKPPYASIIVFNPRDYDYNPMMALAKVYFNQNRPDLALPMLKGCLQVNPRNDYLEVLIAEMERETNLMDDAVTAIRELEKMNNPIDLKKAIESLDSQTRSHPSICSLWNKNFIKTESSGKDIAYYCGMTEHEWSPEMAKTKGVGGSEEAVINLSRQWAKEGWNVTVYNSCGTEPMECDGVTYKPFWMFNHRDKWDRLILWRHPKLVDYELNSSKIYVDVHDVVPAGEFNEKRMAKIDRLFVKTKAHRRLYPLIPDDKFAVIPNGQDFGLFDQDVKKDQYLLVNTSSPDRSMDVLPKLFMKVKERVPQARLKWAYGFDIFDKSFSTNKPAMAWRNECLAEMEKAGIENLGRLSQKECAKLYLEGNILAYPSEFFEIDCITVKKAQACGCIPITTDFGALDESVQNGIKIHSKLTDDTWGKRFTHGIFDEETQNKWVDAVVRQLQKPMGDRTEMKEWAKKFAWPIISREWTNIFQK